MHTDIKPYIDDYGNIKHSTQETIRVMPKYKYKGLLQFTTLHSQLMPAVNTIKTLTPLRVLVNLMLLNTTSEGGSTVNIKQTELSKLSGIARPEISRALKLLKEQAIITEYSRGTITLNPKYIWKGNLNLREEAIENLPK